ncbi:MAG: hypothetical protein L3J35_08125 [Bacteroidales bacterium]|nr:hypothetical protein [Bacteroidales bacterium]
MKPPVCAICDKDFFGTGGLIYFKETEEDKTFNERFKQKGFVGHPKNAFWFCEKHYKTAKKYSHLTKTEAFEKIS